MKKYHLAQLNIAELKAPIDDPMIAGFVARLDEINGLAEGSPGFVWRLKDETGNATEIQAFDSEKMIINMSVWEDVEALRKFTYETMHVEVMRQRKKWFHHMKQAYYVMWWIPVGHEPTLEEAKERLELLREKGATDQAFDFKRSFEAPEE